MTSSEYNELMMEDAYKMLVDELTKAQKSLHSAKEELNEATHHMAACGEVANRFFEQVKGMRK